MIDSLPSPRRLAWRLYEHLAMVVGLSSLAALCLFWLPLAMLLYPVLPQATGQRLGRQTIMWGFRFYLQILTRLCACRFDLSELDGLQSEQGLVIAANHPSLIDAVLLTSRLPNAICVMKSDLMDNPLFGAAARLARYVRNDRALNVILHCREALTQGTQVVIFPESTRTRAFPCSPCTPGLGLLAKQAQASVQTVLIECSSPYLGKSWPLWRPPQLPLHFRARLGRRFPPPTDHRLFTQELDAYFQQELTNSMSGPRFTPY